MHRTSEKTFQDKNAESIQSLDALLHKECTSKHDVCCAPVVVHFLLHEESKAHDVPKW
jgi:hypothetical protein